MGTQRDKSEKEFHRIGWLAVAVGGLLFISLGLELLAHQAFGQTDVATFLLALYLAFWSFALGIAGFLVLSIRWLAEWGPLGMDRMKDEGDHKPSQPGLISVAPSRSAANGDATNTSRDFNRVA